MTKIITAKEAADLLSDTKGRIFSVTFVKRTTGETRTMVARTGVAKHLKGGDAAYVTSRRETDAKRAVAVMVSLVALPSVVLPSTVRLPPTDKLPVTLPLTMVVTHELTFVASQNKKAVLPAATATPVPAEVFRVTTKAVLFCNT
jgi:hypothetical protein